MTDPAPSAATGPSAAIDLVRDHTILSVDLTRLAGDGPSYLPGVIEAKRAAEHGALPADAPDTARLRDDIAALTARLEDERDRSALPAAPTGRRAVHDLVVRTRLG